MSGKTFNARFKNKHDIEANWLKAVNFVPLQGEIIVYDVDENYTYERFKIGDGETLVSDLPFAAVKSWNELEGKPTADDALDLAVEMGLIDAVAAEDNSIYTDENGAIYSL